VYTIPQVEKMLNTYKEYLKETKGVDPDFPNYKFGD
jgi:hypothetical protein